MVKHILTTLLITSFVSLAIFGVFSMNHGMMHGAEQNCVAASAENTKCPLAVNPIDFVTFHISALRNFSTATFTKSLVSTLIALAFLFFLFFKNAVLFQKQKTRRSSLPLTNQQIQVALPLRQALARWLALRTYSPTR